MRHKILCLIGLGLAASLMIPAGCSDDGNTQCPKQVLWLEVSPDSAEVEVGHTVTIEARICAGCESGVEWYVNHALGGNSEYGTITQTNPAVYTAPEQVPYPSIVSVMAVAEKDLSKADGCNITISFTRVHVDVNTGDDTTGTGAVTNPVRSITKGLELAAPGVPVYVANGEYARETGEVFPIVLGDGMTLVGEDWQETKIFADTARIGVQVEGDGCTLRRLSIDLWDYVYLKVTETSSGAVIDSIVMPHVGTGKGIVVDGARGTVIRNCVLVCGMKCFCGWGVVLLGGDTGTEVRQNRIMGFLWGMHISSTSDALIEDCNVCFNEHPVVLHYDDDPEDSPNPDLGGGARGSEGRNNISEGLVADVPNQLDPWCGLTNETPNTIYARNNTWSQYPPVEGTDICNTGGGQVIW